MGLLVTIFPPDNLHQILTAGSSRASACADFARSHSSTDIWPRIVSRLDLIPHSGPHGQTSTSLPSSIGSRSC